jgi:phenylacetate-CoA ligase
MKEYQLYQETEGELVLHIVQKPGFSDDDVRMIMRNLRTRLGDEFSVSIAYMDAIPRTARGKYKFFVQKLPVKYIL